MARSAGKKEKKTSRTTPKEAAEQAYSPSEYREVVRLATLEQIRLVQSQFEMKPALLELADPREVDLAFSSEPVFVQYNGTTGTAMFRWEAVVLPSKEIAKIEEDGEHAVRETGKEALLHVSCDYYIEYTIAGAKSEAAVKAFVENVGELATYPYFRAMAAHYSWESGANLPTLPVVKRTFASARRRDRAPTD